MPQLIMMQIGRRGDFPLASALSLILDGGGHRRLICLSRALAEDRAGMMAPRLSPLSRIAYALAILRLHLPSRRRPRAVLAPGPTSLPIPPFNGPSLRWYEAVLERSRVC